VFELIADLSVNTGQWMRGMSKRLETWLHMQVSGENPLN
jgi:fumarate reductase iron-sulfur subunit